VGFSEVVTRYRDEPLRAAFSPFVLIYNFLNGLFSVFAFLIICRYPGKFGFTEPVPSLLGAIAAGFGSCAVNLVYYLLRAAVFNVGDVFEKDTDDSICPACKRSHGMISSYCRARAG